MSGYFKITATPFYFFIKCGFLVWCYNPQFDGSGVIYNQAIRPILVQYVGMDLSKRVLENKVVQKEAVEPVTVTVEVKQAKQITAMDEIENTTDSYCTLFVEGPKDSSKIGAEDLKQKTRTKQKTLNPTWNEEFIFNDLPKSLKTLENLEK